LRTFVMLSLSKHLYRTVEKPLDGAVEMLRQAQHDKTIFLAIFYLRIRTQVPSLYSPHEIT
jgi:hypothetical protein